VRTDGELNRVSSAGLRRAKLLRFPPFTSAGAMLRLFGMKLFTNYIAKLMGVDLENIGIVRGKRIRLQSIHRKDPNRAACVG
jgi:hypothetical protein